MRNPVGDSIPAVLRHCVTQQVTDVELPADWTVDHATREIAQAISLPERNAENVAQEYELDELEPLPEVIPGRWC
jgi:hypothetical protein